MNDNSAVLEDIKERAGQSYASPLEHLFDLMKRQDLLVRRAVTQNRKGRDRVSAWERFAAVSDEEVEDLLRQAGDREFRPEPSQEAIRITSRLADLDDHISKRLACSIKAGIRLPLPELSRIFGLSPLETNVLMTCIAVEIDKRYERFYGYLHDDMTRRTASIGLILSFCCDSPEEEIRHRPIFSPPAPLMRYHLLHIVDETPGGSPFLSKTVRIDSRIASFLLGEHGLDSRIHDTVQLFAPPADLPARNDVHASLAARLVGAIEGCLDKKGPKKKPLFYLHGRTGAGRSALVREVCRHLGLQLLTVDAGRIAASTIGFEEGLLLAFRENLLCQSLIHIRHVDDVLEQKEDRRLASLLQYVEEMGGITFLSGEKPWSSPVSPEHILFLPVDVGLPDYDEQTQIWNSELQARGRVDAKELSFIVSKYPSSPEEIKDAVTTAETYAALRGGTALITPGDIHKACRSKNIPDLGHIARKIEPKSGLKDIILPHAQMSQLREICNQVHYRSVVYGAWGFGRKLSLGKGLNALFCGPPGTGKTMAAEVVANELCLDLYKIDLSQVVSKYIGETEKNLHQIFRKAETSHAILFFDEADALMGKRSDVKDSHDRYANLEIAYLLQKMEEYEGITVLATNLRQNMDEAFTRRIRFIIEFPFPEEDSRLRIWKGIWPKETPLAENVDLTLLAKRFKLSGGNIRNIALASAFLASSDGGAVEMKHLLKAAKQEFLKMGRLVDESEFARSGARQASDINKSTR